MATSLFVEQHANGLAFYINGDLQFDTADEAIYHEYLVIPAIALAIERFPNINLRVLMCGGGDGLAARDILRFPQVSHIDLVDYSPEVLNLGRTEFKPYNSGSLESNRLTVHVREAFEFVSAIPDNFYHLVICDFTYPTSPEDTRIYSRDWYQQLSRVLQSGGIVSTNGVSPESRTTAFWCLYQTLLAVGLMAKPLQLNIPSFRRHGYGNWGFFLASGTSIDRAELESITLPDNLQALTHHQLLRTFVFESAIANIRHNVAIHTLDCPQLFYYLLNPTTEVIGTDEIAMTVDFLDIQESDTSQVGRRDWLQLESTAQAWLEQIDQSSKGSKYLSTKNLPDLTKLLPVQHRYHSQKMTAEWLSYLKQLLAEIDLSHLLNSLSERAQELPPQVANDLKILSEKIRSGQPLSHLPPSTGKFLTMLSVTLLMANVVAPDAVFAKGYSSSSSNTSYVVWTAQQTTGLSLMGVGSLLLVILGLTFVDWSGSNNE